MASSRPLHIQLHARQTRVVRARTPALQRTTRVRRTSTASAVIAVTHRETTVALTWFS